MGTKIMDDDVTTMEEAALNKYCAGDGTVATGAKGYATWGLCVRYTGAAWEARSTWGARAQTGNVVLTWDGVNEWLTVDTTSCDNTFGATPVCNCTPYYDDSTFDVKAMPVSTVLTRVRFFDPASGARETTETTDMHFNIIWFGEI